MVRARVPVYAVIAVIVVVGLSVGLLPVDLHEGDCVSPEGPCDPMPVQYVPWIYRFLARGH